MLMLIDGKKVSEPLSWEDLADLYGERTGGRARIMPMKKVFEWGKQQDDLLVHPEEGTMHKIQSSKS